MTNRCYIIAEAGVNHNGSLELAKILVDAACAAGADAVKFQAFNTDDVVISLAPAADYQKQNVPGVESQLEILKKLELSHQDFAVLAQYCQKKGIEFLATPFDHASADMLEKLRVSSFKVSSGDLTHLELLAHIARKNIPIILSTGMADLGEIAEALETIASAGNPPVTILHCVSNYPAVAEDANLRAMQTITQAFGKPVGWSDHMENNMSLLAAVALGAVMVEKHFTLDRSLPGPDHVASIEPDELKMLVKNIRLIESSLGSGRKVPATNEIGTAVAARRSLVTTCNILAGTRITEQMLAAKRPGTGLKPKYKKDILGLFAGRDLAAETVVGWSDFSGGQAN